MAIVVTGAGVAVVTGGAVVVATATVVFTTVAGSTLVFGVAFELLQLASTMNNAMPIDASLPTPIVSERFTEHSPLFEPSGSIGMIHRVNRHSGHSGHS